MNHRVALVVKLVQRLNKRAKVSFLHHCCKAARALHHRVVIDGNELVVVCVSQASQFCKAAVVDAATLQRLGQNRNPLRDDVEFVDLIFVLKKLRHRDRAVGRLDCVERFWARPEAVELVWVFGLFQYLGKAGRHEYLFARPLVPNLVALGPHRLAGVFCRVVCVRVIVFVRERNPVALGSAKPFDQVGAGHQLAERDPVYVCPTLAGLDHEVLPVNVFAAVCLVSDVFVGVAARERCARLVKLNQAFVYGVALRAAHILHTRLLAHVVEHRQHVDRFAVVALHDCRTVNDTHDATADDQVVADGTDEFAVEIVLFSLVTQRPLDNLRRLTASRVLVAVAANDARAWGARVERSLKRLDVGIEDIHSGDALLASVVVVAVSLHKRSRAVAPLLLVVARVADLF